MVGGHLSRLGGQAGVGAWGGGGMELWLSTLSATEPLGHFSEIRCDPWNANVSHKNSLKRYDKRASTFSPHN